jgi:tetratricopeptide (TPR) repeat protein
LTQIPEPVAQYRSSIPGTLAALVMRLLEKRPADRPQSAEEVLHELDAMVVAASGGTVAAHPAGPVARPIAARRGPLRRRAAVWPGAALPPCACCIWEWRRAEQAFRRAIALNPSYATAHHWYAECLSVTGRPDEALAELEQALSLDPLSSQIRAQTGLQLYRMRRYDAAIARLRNTLDLHPR